MAPKAEDTFVNGYDGPSPKTVAEVSLCALLARLFVHETFETTTKLFRPGFCMV